MNRRYSVIAAFTIFISLAMTTYVRAASHAQALYSEALMKETGERDPEAAVPLYQQAIEEAGPDHKLVSKARLHLGGCYERIGKPKEAEAIYLQIINESAESIMEAVHAAQANLERLQAQEKKVQAEAAKYKPMVLAKEFHDTRWALSGGPEMVKSGTHLSAALDLEARYPISRPDKPLAILAEFGALVPLGGTDIQNQSQPYGSQTDQASLNLNYQIHLGLVAELPHGQEQNVIPEMGAGAALTGSTIDLTSESSNQSIWSPYLMAGLHFWPKRRVSFLLETTYTANPYAKSVDIASPAHPQSFDFPNSLWTIAAQVQIKIGSTKTVLRPKE